MIPITVFIADDHPLVREGTRQILEQHADLQVIGEAERGDRAVELIAQVQPHVVLLDVRLPGLSGIEASARIVRSWPEIKVLLLSAYDDEDYLLAALQAGAAGYLLKTAPSTEVIAAVRAAHRGETVLSSAVARKVAQYWQRGAPSEGPSRLSAREIEVLRLLAHGCCNKEIATELRLSGRTVEGHVGNLFGKLGVTSRTEAVLHALQHRLLTLESFGS
ncbi:MAG TPA: response regulator transcription factor [Chloroflexota bacterium]